MGLGIGDYWRAQEAAELQAVWGGLYWIYPEPPGLRAARRDLASGPMLARTGDELRDAIRSDLAAHPVLPVTVDWSQEQPERCYFYPGRDCPGWAAGGTCQRVGRSIQVAP